MAKGKNVESVLTIDEFYAIMAKNDNPIGVIADIKAVLEPEQD
jgi:hypothetical protein